MIAIISDEQYMSGFGNEFASEALPGALPKAQVNNKTCDLMHVCFLPIKIGTFARLNLPFDRAFFFSDGFLLQKIKISFYLPYLTIMLLVP